LILTGPEIEKEIAAGRIVIEPYDPKQVQPNSVDLHLGPELLVYDAEKGYFDIGDRQWHGEPPHRVDLDETGGYLLRPGFFALGHTIEETYTPYHVPLLEGKSSLARLSCTWHCSAGVGDVSYRGQWVLEISCIVPVFLRSRLPVCQIMFNTVCGSVKPYQGRYQGSRGVVPAKV
jgi:dCTP deaminase